MKLSLLLKKSQNSKHCATLVSSRRASAGETKQEVTLYLKKVCFSPRAHAHCSLKSAVKVKSRKVMLNPDVSWGNALLVDVDISQKIVGKVLTVVDSLGLPAQQEKAVKDLMRSGIYDLFDHAWYIGSEDHAMLRKKIYEFGQLSLGGVHPSNIPCTVDYATVPNSISN